MPACPLNCLFLEIRQACSRWISDKKCKHPGNRFGIHIQLHQLYDECMKSEITRTLTGAVRTGCEISGATPTLFQDIIRYICDPAKTGSSNRADIACDSEGIFAISRPTIMRTAVQPIQDRCSTVNVDFWSGCPQTSHAFDGVRNPLRTVRGLTKGLLT